MRRQPLGQILTISKGKFIWLFSNPEQVKILLFNLDDEPGWVPSQDFLGAKFHGHLSLVHNKVPRVNKGRPSGGHEATVRQSSGRRLGWCGGRIPQVQFWELCPRNSHLLPELARKLPSHPKCRLSQCNEYFNLRSFTCYKNGEWLSSQTFPGVPHYRVAPLNLRWKCWLQLQAKGQSSRWGSRKSFLLGCENVWEEACILHSDPGHLWRRKSQKQCY